MIFLLKICVFLILLSGTSYAQDPTILDKYQWTNRVLLVYTTGFESPDYQQQIQEFKQHQKGMEDRDLVILTILPQEVIDPAGKAISSQTATYLREQFSISGDRFAVILIGKDGGVKLTEEKFLTAGKLFATIDQMPMRQREMRAN